MIERLLTQNKKKILSSLLFGFLYMPVWAQLNSDSLRRELAEYFSEQPLTGGAVSVFTPERMLFADGFGYSSKAEQIPYTITTLQPIASVSKTLVGVALMKAQEMGVLNLDDDINKYLQFRIVNPHIPNDIITIRHLASHSSGLRDRKINRRSYIFQTPLRALLKNLPIGIKRFVAGRYIRQYEKNTIMSMEAFLWNAYHPGGKWYSKRNFLKKPAGAQYEYSNNATALAALVLENAAGIDFPTFAETHILKPLQMNQSAWSRKELSDELISKLYIEGEELPDYELITYPDGGFITSLTDFSIFVMAVMRGYKGESNVLSASSYNEMLTFQINPEFKTGVFWVINNNSIQHAGGDPGILTLTVFGKESLTGITIFLNTSDIGASTDHLLNIFNIVTSCL